ncbi:MAG TPA: FAD-binding oxidoreductase, partial [Candidatus Omnitrophota bacterium]|nr:FAD-binding oxidoreductase [Candidatus Omnitrophota bacterium]
MIIKRDPDIIKGYLEDTSNLRGGFADAVMLPENIMELSDLVRESNNKKTPMTVSGGGTATTGSRVPFGGIIISLEKLDSIREVSVEKMSCLAQSAALVDEIRTECDKKGLFYPSHPTERSATVGGTVSTNASGARSFKYGPTRKFVNSLAMVMPTGEVLSLRRGERFLSKGDAVIELPGGRRVVIPIPDYAMPATKNAAGYYAKDGMDLIDLFIGQEGTLSIITDVELGLVRRPEKIFSSFVFFADERNAWGFAAEARDISKVSAPGSGIPGISALSIEYFDVNALRLLSLKNPNVPPSAKAAIFFEQEVALKTESSIVDMWLKLITKHGASLEDTWVAMTEEDVEVFNSFRHSIPEAVNETVRRNGFQKLSTDIAVPDDKVREILEHYSKTLKECGMDHVVFGHIGENHVHTNILPRSAEENEKAKKIVIDFVNKAVSLGGTVSAEHGIGKIKKRYLEIMYGSEGVRAMARIKKAFDPNCLLGLDNVIS